MYVCSLTDSTLESIQAYTFGKFINNHDNQAILLLFNKNNAIIGSGILLLVCECTSNEEASIYND